MNFRKAVLLICILLIVLPANSCTSANGSIGSVTPTITETLTPTSILTRNPTNTVTPTLFPTPTITSLPTLSAEDARTMLIGLLGNNGGCRLSCLWGITPGISTIQEAQIRFAPLSSIAYKIEINYYPDEKIWSGNIVLDYKRGDLDIITGMYIKSFTTNNKIYNISFFAGTLKEVKELSYYMLPHMLSEYGLPSSVLLRTPGGPAPTGGFGLFEIVILYPQKGFLVHYQVQAQMSGNNMLGCMTNNNVDLFLFPSINEADFMDYLPGGWSDLLQSYKPLEEATSMTLEQYYQTFSKPTDQCLKTPSSMWPTPEGPF
jgi:hypothetical protein